MSKRSSAGCGGPILEGDLSLKNLIKAIGKGPRLARDLTQDEARAAFGQILDGHVEPEQTGAFLLAERIKGESIDETVGFILALRDRVVSKKSSRPLLLELASAHDGKLKTLVLTPFVAMILGKMGIPTLVSGGVDVPTKKGVTAGHVFHHLKIAASEDHGQLEADLSKRGFAYVQVSDYCPKLEALKSKRDVLGLRTFLNTVEKGINPYGATHLCTGVFHGPYLKDLATALQLTGERNVLCVQAPEAGTDLPLKKRVLCRHVKDGVLSEQFEIDPAIFQLKTDADVELPSGVTDENDADNALIDCDDMARKTITAVYDAVLTQSGIVYDALIYNVAVQLWFVGVADDVADGIKKVRAILKSDFFAAFSA